MPEGSAEGPVPGTVLRGRYEILDFLAEGGMGSVWRGRDTCLNRAVAIKLMHGRCASPPLAARLQREAVAAGAIDHPGITTVYDSGVHDGHPFMVMQLLRGRDLAAILRERRGGLPAGQAADYILQAARALKAAHASGVIHRDLKPANLFITTDGTLKICDFGIAKVADATRTLSEPGKTVGTPAYMSPEQWTGDTIDARTDLYSLGCVFYELVTGRPPFDPDQPVKVLYAQHAGMEPPPLLSDPSIPPRLADLIMRLLSKSPGDRPRTAAALVAELEEICRALLTRSREVPGTTAVPGPGAKPGIPSPQPTRKYTALASRPAVLPAPRREPRPFILGFLAGVLDSIRSIAKDLPAPLSYPFWALMAIVWTLWVICLLLLLIVIIILNAPFLTTTAVLVETGVGWEPLPWLTLLLPGVVLTAVGSMAFGAAARSLPHAVLAVPAYCLTEASLLLFAFHRMSPALVVPVGVLAWSCCMAAGLLAMSPPLSDHDSMSGRAWRCLAGSRPRVWASGYAHLSPEPASQHSAAGVGVIFHLGLLS